MNAPERLNYLLLGWRKTAQVCLELSWNACSRWRSRIEPSTYSVLSWPIQLLRLLKINDLAEFKIFVNKGVGQDIGG